MKKLVVQLWKNLLWAFCCLSSCFAVNAANPPDDAVVFIQVYYEKDNQIIVVDEGSGFIVNPVGWAVTAKHVLDAQVPKDYERKYRGAVGSNTETSHQMFAVPGYVITADAGLLMFSPQLKRKWPYLKVMPDKQLQDRSSNRGFGFSWKGIIQPPWRDN